MKEILVGRNEAGQRLDKLAVKFLPLASKSFVYKMIRKKNITLNDRKCEGNEMLSEGDSVKFWLADDTITSFQNQLNLKINKSEESPLDRNDLTGSYKSQKVENTHKHNKYLSSNDPEIIFEDDDIIIFNKPAGMLSQKAVEYDITMNDILVYYLLQSEQLTPESLKTFRPSICNRLDRNTSGLIVCGKSLKGLQDMSKLLKERTAHKDYIAFVKGVLREGQQLRGYLLKDTKDNIVAVSNKGARIETDFKPLWTNGKKTIVMVRLITGKTHQIRAHLASIGHPILGDKKYGDGLGAKRQLLHAYRLTLPDGRIFTATLPEDMKWQLGKPEAFEDLPWRI